MYPRILRKHFWFSILTLILLLVTTSLAAAQSPDVYMPLVTGEGETEQQVPDTPVDEAAPPLLEPDPSAPVGDSRDTDSGDHDIDRSAEEVGIAAAFNASQWTVSGKLGVGTTAPTADIELARNGNTYARLMVSNPHTGDSAQTQLYLTTAPSNALVLQQFGTGYTPYWGALPLTNMARLRTTPSVKGLIIATGGTAAPLVFGTADTERMRITSSGRVGIGRTSPAHLLSLASGPYWTESFWSGAIDLANSSAIGWRPNGAGYSVGMGHTNDGFHIFRATNAPGTTGTYPICDMSINNQGHVGIGTNIPQVKLDVHGNARVYGGNLALTYGDLNIDTGNINIIDGGIYVNGQHMHVPDYVFEPDYPLLSLDELRAYVTKEKHLPNVPSEEEIYAGDLDLIDFQMKLLEKTEELTLYTLAQDEQIESLQQTNQSQAEQLDALKQENQAMQQMIADLETRLAALEEQE